MGGERIPPGVTFAFEKIAHEICHRAALEEDEATERAHEIVTLLREKFRDGIANELSTAQAEENAIAALDQAGLTSTLRRPWMLRLLFFRRSRATRQLIFLGAYALYCWIVFMNVHLFDGV